MNDSQKTNSEFKDDIRLHTQKDNFLSEGFVLNDNKNKKNKLSTMTVILIVILVFASLPLLFSLINHPKSNYPSTADENTNEISQSTPASSNEKFFSNFTRKKVTVPDVTTLSTEKAEQILKQYNLVAESVKNPDDPDTVNTTNPPAGTIVDEGTKVKLYYLPVNKY